jgi:hypothetical protein
MGLSAALTLPASRNLPGNRKPRASRSLPGGRTSTGQARTIVPHPWRLPGRNRVHNPKCAAKAHRSPENRALSPRHAGKTDRCRSESNSNDEKREKMKRRTNKMSRILLLLALALPLLAA